MTQLATAWVSIRAETKGLGTDVRKALGDVEKSADASGQSMGSKLSSGIGKTLKRGALATGVAAGTALATAMTKGIGRLNAIEQAESKLTGLGHSASTVEGALSSALKSVKGTAFGLDEAATTASMVMAAGIKPGQELEQVLTTVGDSAAISGRSMSEMGAIFGKVAAKGKLQGDDLFQLAEAGIPALQFLSEELGVTTAEVAEMASRGEIDFATFERAMRRGVGGAAQEMGNTTQGAFKNMMAAMGRFGATLAGPFFTQAGSVFRGLTNMFDNLDTAAGPVMDRLGLWMTSTAVPALRAFGKSAADAFKEFAGSELAVSSLSRLQGVFSTLSGVGVSVGRSLVDIGSALAEAGQALGVSAWQVFLSTLEAASAVLAALSGPLEAVSGFMKDHPGLVTAAVAAWTGFKTIPSVLGLVAAASTKLSTATTAVQAGAVKAATAMKGLGTAAVVSQVQMGRFGTAVAAVGSHVPVVSRMQGAFVNAAVGADRFGRTAGIAAAGMTGLRAGASGLLGVLGGPLGIAVTAVSTGLIANASSAQSAKAANQALADAASQGEFAQRGLASALVETNNALEGQALAAASDIAAASMSRFVELGSRGHTTIENLGHVVDNLTGNVFGLNNAWEQDYDRVTNSVEGYDSLTAAAANAGIPMSEVNNVVAQGGPLYEQLRAGIDTTTEGGRNLATAMDSARDSISNVQSAVANSTPGMTSLLDAFETLSDASASSADKVNAVRQALFDLKLAADPASATIGDLTQKVDSIAQSAVSGGEAFAGLGQSLLNGQGQLDQYSVGGAALGDTLDDLATTFITTALATGDAQAAYAQLTPAFQALADTTGLPIEKIKELAAAAGVLPSQVDMMVNLNGKEDTEAQIAAVKEKAAQLGGQPVLVPVDALTDDAIAGLDSVGFKVQEVEGKPGVVEVVPETAAAKNELDAIKARQTDLDGSTSTVTIDGNKVPLDTKIEGAGGQLLGLTGKSANPTIGANKTPFDTSIWGANSQLFGFDQSGGSATLSAEDQAFFGSLNAANLGVWGFGSMYAAATLGANAGQAHTNTAGARNDINSISGLFPIATLDANGQPAHTNTGSARTDIESINNAKGTGKLDADNSAVKPNVDTAQGWINGLFGRTVTVTFRAVYEGFRDMVGLGNSTGGAWNGSKALPRFAGGGHAGYRLPTSGPGTTVTDGFVAFDQNNVPAARLDAGEWIINRRNSEKYNKELAQINAGTFPKLPGYADGGQHGIRSPKQMLDFVWNRTSDGQSRALDGAPYDWAGINWGDCSGAMSAIARFATGLAPFGGRFATGNMREALAGMGFTIGRGNPGDLRFGWWNGGVGGGHTFGTLPDGTNVEMRGGGRGGIIGKDAWAWNHPQATDHAFLPMPSFKFAGASGLDAFTPPTIDGGASTGSATAGVGSYAASQAGYSGAKDNTPKTWSDVTGTAAYNLVSGLTEDALGVFGVPNDLPPILQAYNMMQDAEEHGGVSTWDVSQAAAKLKQYEAEIELRKRVVAEGKKAVDLMRDSKVGDPGIGVLSAAENKLEDEVKLLRKAAENADLAKARLDELLETREAAALAKQSGASGMSTSELGQAAGGLGEFPDTSFPDNINKEIRISYDPSKDANQWRPLISHVLAAKGIPETPELMDSIVRRMNQESNGNPRAINNWDSNAQRGDPSKGLLQTIGSTFRANADPGFDKDIYDPESNIRASMNYAIKQYGSLRAAYDRAGGYWKGGPIPFGSGVRDDVPLVASQGEFIVNRFAAARNRGLLEDINNGSTRSESNVTYNVYGFDLESSMRELDKRQKQRALSGMGVR